MRKLLLFLPLFMLPGLCFTQQRPQYSLYMISNYLVNPAITGVEDYTDIKLGHRLQWVGIKGAPVTTFAYAHTPLGKTHNTSTSNLSETVQPYLQQYNKYRSINSHHGIGGAVFTDKIGPFRQSEFQLSYAYHVMLSPSLKLSQGIAAGVTQYLLDTERIVLEKAEDVTASTGNIQRFSPNLTAGGWLHSNVFFVVASVTQTFGSRINFLEANNLKNSTLARHYFLTGGFRILPLKEWAIVSSTMVKWVTPAPVSVDLSSRVIYHQRIWGGITYRIGDALVALGGITINHLLEIAYGYDTSVSGLAGMNAGSHEIIIGLKLRNKHKVICPQNLW